MGRVTIKPAAQVAEERIEALKRKIVGAVQARLDSEARKRGYDSILSLTSYAPDPDPTFSAEGQAGVEWRGKVWAYCYAELARVQAGEREVPTPDEFVAELPAARWPA